MRATTALAHAARQPPRDLAQRRVACHVAERVVERLEPVEIDHQDRDGAAVGLRALQRGIERALERPAVGKPGERVRVGLAADAPLAPHALGHVDVGAQRPVGRAVGLGQRPRVGLHPHRGAVAPLQLQQLATDGLAAHARRRLVGARDAPEAIDDDHALLEAGRRSAR
jgi:hypothetical protein